MASNSTDIPIELGTPLLQYCPTSGERVFAMSLAGIGLLLLLVAYEIHVPLIVDIVGLILLGIGLYLGFHLIQTPYMICPHGIMYRKRRKWHARPWNEVKAIWPWGTITLHHGTLDGDRDRFCAILLQDGTRLKLKHLSNELGNWLEATIYSSLIARARAQWAAGQPVWFGSICLSPTGVHTRKEVICWRDVQVLKHERYNDTFVIRKNSDSSFQLTVDEVHMPNLSLFWLLTRENLIPSN